MWGTIFDVYDLRNLYALRAVIFGTFVSLTAAEYPDWMPYATNRAKTGTYNFPSFVVCYLPEDDRKCVGFVQVVKKIYLMKEDLEENVTALKMYICPRNVISNIGPRTLLTTVLVGNSSCSSATSYHVMRIVLMRASGIGSCIVIYQFPFGVNIQN